MRLTFVLPAPSRHPVGGFRVVFEIANQLAADGHKVRVVLPSRMRNISVVSGILGWARKLGGYALNKAFRPGVGWLPLDHRVELLYVWEPLAEAVPDGDYVFATAWQTSEYVNRYPPSKGRKGYIVMDFHPWFASQEILERTWHLPLRKFAICQWLENVVKASGASDVRWLPLGIDHARFRVTIPPASREPVVAMMYSRAKYKDLETGLSALDVCRRSGAHFRCLLFGSIAKRPREIPEWIEYQGTLSDGQLVTLYNTASVFVGSSIAEGFAFPVAEAMSCGCAAATTDCGGNRDYAVHEDNALISPAGDAQVLGNHILRLLADRTLRTRLALAGVESLRAFHWKRSVASLLDAMGETPSAGDP